MSDLNIIFDRLVKLVRPDKDNELMKTILKVDKENKFKDAGIIHNYNVRKTYVQDIIDGVDAIAVEIKRNEILLSVNHQKVLRTCFQFLIMLGLYPCLTPGLGINLIKKYPMFDTLPLLIPNEHKYDILVICTDFLQRSYEVPVLKNVIMTFHLSDYLAALIQLAFAPLKKPGVYPDFTITEEMYAKYNLDRQKYIQVYEHLVTNCFQPILMKELLVLQGAKDPPPPTFLKRVIAKEMSRRLTASGGLLSLIRCLIETRDMDRGVEWKKINIITRIVTTTHCNSEDDYLKNIVLQLKQILSLNNLNYLTTAISCLIGLHEKYNESEPVTNLMNDVFNVFNYEILSAKPNLPGTIVITPQEVEHGLQLLQACTLVGVNITSTLISTNLYMLFLLRIKCTKDETKSQLHSLILKCLELLKKDELCYIIEKFLIGPSEPSNILVEEYEAGLTVKCTANPTQHPKGEALMLFVDFFHEAIDETLIKNLFESCLQIFIRLSSKRQETSKKILNDDEIDILTADDENYAQMLHILFEISTSQKATTVLKENPLIVINFVESYFLKNIQNKDNETITTVLVLLNIVLSNMRKTKDFQQRLQNLLPILKKIGSSDDEYICTLCTEATSLILSEHQTVEDSAYEKALSNVYDSLLPVRAHGIMELTKLINKGDPTTISRRHYLFCLFQEQLKDPDSYVYLSAINGIASLATRCTDEVLTTLCREFLEMSSEPNNVDTMEKQNKIAELRMKIGDIIVKVTKQLGEMAIVHKTVLLNTMLCASRDDDPLIRASALSNLAEIVLVLHYKLGTIIHEILLCVWSIIETDKVIECRRAAVMVISSLIKGLGRDTLIELKENLLPIYRTINRLYKDTNEDSVVKLHAQIALEELNDVVNEFLKPKLPMDKEFLMLNKTDDIVFK